MIDGQARIITGLYYWYTYYFVIIWENALHEASGERLTFQIVLKQAPAGNDPDEWLYGQSDIWINYQSVSAINTYFTFGIEDQQGRKGNGDLLDGAWLQYFNQQRIVFYQYSNMYYLKRLSLTFEDSSTQSRINIDENPSFMRGYHVAVDETLPPPEPDPTYMLATALTGSATLLISALSLVGGVPMWVAGAGFMVDTVLVGLNWGDFLAYHQYSSREIAITDLDDGVAQSATAEAFTYDYVVDATLGLIVDWVLDDPNDQPHTLTITAKLEYYEYVRPDDIIDMPPITTSVSLNIGLDDNDSFGTADTIEEGTYTWLYLGGGSDGSDVIDYYTFNVADGQIIDVKMTPPQYQDFDLYLYDPSRTKMDSSEQRGDATETVSVTAGTSGYWFVKVKHVGGDGFYTLELHLYSGGGGCPFIYTWNGNQYIIDNNLLPKSVQSAGSDVDDYYKLEQRLVPIQGGTLISFYSLLIREFQREHSYLDRVRLIGVDHDSSVNVAVTSDGEILTYEEPFPPFSAVDEHSVNWLGAILSIDEQHYQGHDGSHLLLDFENIDVSRGAKLVLKADFPVKRSVYVQILDSEGRWQNVTTIIPRVYWATEIVDLSEYLLDANGALKVRLYFTASHKIDFVGLDTSEQADIEIHKARLASAVHSEEGIITRKLLRSDNIYAELIPEQQIKLTFLLLKQRSKNARTFIIYTKGHYSTIVNEG